MAKDLILRLEQLSLDAIIHSNMRRTRMVAERAADMLAIKAHADACWRERNFGSWEGRSWNAIYRETGNAMDGMINNPHGFRPGGGETTAELSARSLAALNSLPADQNIAVITHGGPIAAILARRDNADLSSLPGYIPALNSFSEIDMPTL